MDVYGVFYSRGMAKEGGSVIEEALFFFSFFQLSYSLVVCGPVDF